ncbi:hypothetical protein Tco_1173886 [Tanacetum coccineum]
MVDKDKEIDEARLSTEDEVSTVKEGVSTDFEKVSTDRPIVSTDGSKVSTDRPIKGTDELKEGTKEHNKSTEEQREGTEEKVESTDGQIKLTMSSFLWRRQMLPIHFRLPQNLPEPASGRAFKEPIMRGYRREAYHGHQPVPQDEDDHSPTAESPGYITESDPEEDPEGYEDDETEDGPVDYPMDGGDDGDDDDGETSRMTPGMKDEDREDEETIEEEQLSSGLTTTHRQTAELACLPHLREQSLLKPPADHRHILLGARITVRTLDLPIIPSTSVRVERLASSYWPTIPPPPLTTNTPSLSCIPSPVDHRDDIPESEQPPRKRLHLSTIGSRYEIGESSTARSSQKVKWIDYWFSAQSIAEEKRQGIRDRVILLIGDRMTLRRQYDGRRRKAYASREAWGRSIGLRPGGLIRRLSEPIMIHFIRTWRPIYGTPDTANILQEYSHSDPSPVTRDYSFHMQAD